MGERTGVFTPGPGSGRAAYPSLPAVESNLSSAGASGGPREKTGRNTARCVGNTSLGDRAKNQTRTAPGSDPASRGWEGEVARCQMPRHMTKPGGVLLALSGAISCNSPCICLCNCTLAHWPAWRLPAQGSCFSSSCQASPSGAREILAIGLLSLTTQGPCSSSRCPLRSILTAVYRFLAAYGGIYSHLCARLSMIKLLYSYKISGLHHHTDTWSRVSGSDQLGHLCPSNAHLAGPASLENQEQQVLLCFGKSRKEAGPTTKVSLQRKMLDRASEP